jgi:hypothetical protein
MTDRRFYTGDVGRMIGLLLEGQLNADECRRLEQILLSDPVALDHYLDYVELHSLLHWQYCPEEKDEFDGENREYENWDSEGLDWNGESNANSMASPVGLMDDFSPVSSSSSTKQFSYWISAVLLGFSALLAWEWEIADCQGCGPYRTIESNFGFPVAFIGGPVAKPMYVGRITEMVDCQWASGESAPSRLDYVAVGRKFHLESGLIEITYGMGAGVIIQGPAIYEVCSNGGMLITGRLTGRMDSTKKNATATPTPSSPNYTSPKFSIRTPTTMVVDLDTEFGLEVAENGSTTSYVFCGSIELHPFNMDEQRPLLLTEKEAARVELLEDNRVWVSRCYSVDTTQFIRQIGSRASMQARSNSR